MEKNIISDYEVLEVKEDGLVYSNFDGEYWHIKGKTMGLRINVSCLLGVCTIIHKVKRLSSDEIFTIGSKVANTMSEKTIENIVLLNGKWVFNYNRSANSWFPLVHYALLKEKDYEILSVTVGESTVPVKFGKDLIKVYESSSNPLKIHSIVRAQDGKVFTVGDKFKDGKITRLEEKTSIPVNSPSPKKKNLWIFHDGEQVNAKLSDVPLDYHNKYFGDSLEKKKDYEILTVTHKYSATAKVEIIDISPNLNMDRYNIHSVKRLSDDEVFTINDRIDHIKKHWKDSIIITGFELIDGRELKVRNSSRGSHSLSRIVIKKPIFTTEDGVDIFERDTFYIINKNTFCWKYWGKLKYDFKASEKTPRTLKKEDLTFSTIEAAEKYILFNKPCLSINDIGEVW